MDTNRTEEDYIGSKEFEDNLEEQYQFMRNYRLPINSTPFDVGFKETYTHFRACLASLRNNPDTKDDEDFKELCEIWNRQREYFSPLVGLDYGSLEAKYRLLCQKPVFKNNHMFSEMYGAFVKSVYLLLTEGGYWQHLFDLD